MIHLALLVASALFLLWVAFIGLAVAVGVACRITNYCKRYAKPDHAVLWAAVGMGVLAVIFHWLGLS